MADTTVIIHGWSDCSDSFVAVKQFLVANGVGNVETVYYADYESREDSITYDDVIDGLNDEFLRRGFIDSSGNAKAALNIIVHSTGGLVIRHWLWRYYLRDGRPLADCPVKRIVMLAPANFGSPLAQRGKSFLGELVKGRWKIGDLLEVGRQLLDGLELGSPYQWQLAHRDLLVPNPLFGADKIQLTILVGCQDYDGIRGWVNKPGTDGTVVISGTSIDSVKFMLDCCTPADEGDGYQPYQWFKTKAVSDFAWGVLQGLDHGEIVDDVRKPNGGTVGPILLQALTSKNAAAFKKLENDLVAMTDATYAATHKPVFQQFIVHAVDDQDVSIRDFTIEFGIRKAARADDGVLTTERLTKQEDDFSSQAQDLFAREFHPHSIDPSYRRFSWSRRRSARCSAPRQRRWAPTWC